MSTRICIAVCEPTMDEAVAAIGRAAPYADLIEIRADYIRDLDLRRLFQDKPCPMLFALRPVQWGGRYKGSERNRLELILQAARMGTDYVEVEFSSFWKPVLESIAKTKVVLSYRNPEEVPTSLDAVFESMAATEAGVLRIVCHARCLADNLRIADLLKRARERGIRLAALASGTAGIPSLIFGSYWGSWLTPAAAPGSEPDADGELTQDLLTDTYRIRSIGPDTQVYGVLGNPVGHSLSPHLHNPAFEARGVNAVYLPLQAAGVDDFEAFQAVLPIQGASVTIPFKEEVAKRVYSISVEAQEIGAVNTLVRKDRGWHGDNTDFHGFLRPLRRRLSLNRMRAVVLGSGGSARAVVYSLRSQGTSVCIVARNLEKARRIAEEFQAEYAPWERLREQHWDLLINTTPLGMHPRVGETPVPPECFTGRWVYDLVYNPVETRFLQDAAARGCKVICGTEMLLEQAFKQQQLWLGAPVPESTMEAALDAALKRLAHRPN